MLLPMTFIKILKKEWRIFNMSEVDVRKIKKAFMDIKNKYPERFNLDKINSKIAKIDSISADKILIKNL